MGGRGGGRGVGGDRSRAAAKLLAQRTCLQVGVWERRHLRSGPEDNFRHKDALRHTTAFEKISLINLAKVMQIEQAVTLLLTTFPYLDIR